MYVLKIRYFRSIVGSVGLPLSIIIVGVGDEDFSAMEVLDGDKGGLRADGKVCTV